MFSRADRIKKAIMKETAEIIQRGVKDPRISTIVSVTEVELSPDYRYAKIYVSIFGNEKVVEETMEALTEQTPRIRCEIGKRIKLRYTPEIEIKLDDSLERGSRINSLIDKISRGEL